MLLGKTRYLYTVVWSDEDSVYIGRVAEFGLLGAHADTAEEALHEIKTVVGIVLDDMAEKGEAAPQPLGDESFSGNLQLRMAPSLHRALAAEARREGISLNLLLTTKLSRSV